MEMKSKFEWRKSLVGPAGAVLVILIILNLISRNWFGRLDFTKEKMYEKFALSLMPEGKFEKSDKFFEKCIMLPMNDMLDNDEIYYICDKVNTFYK